MMHSKVEINPYNYVVMEDDREWLTHKEFFKKYGFEPNDKMMIREFRTEAMRKGQEEGR